MSLAETQQQLTSADGDGPIRVMIVDDSAVVRGLVSRWIGEEEGVEAVARHQNGKLAVDDIVKSSPDVVVLDIEMPVMDGLTALPLLLKAKPSVKIIMASTLTRRNAEISLKALSLGATDYVPKPDSNRGITTSATFRADLLQKIKAVVPRRRGAVSRPLVRPGLPDRSQPARPGIVPDSRTQFKLRRFSNVAPRLLTIGSSTGGPQALLALFKAIVPAISNTPVLIVQHMPGTFTAILAEHISKATGLVAKEGEHQEPVRPGRVYVAPGGKHMILAGSKMVPVLELNNGPEINFCRPAVDPLFQSVAGIFGPATLALVLTGMGQDGASGAGSIADAGGSVIAQDEASSVVWGMPGATAMAGHCSAVLPLGEIGPKVNMLLRGGVA